MTEMKKEQGVEALAENLRARGWDVSESHDGEEAYREATLEVELTRSVTDGEFDVYDDPYPEAFVAPTYARWDLDLGKRLAEMYVYDGGLTSNTEPFEDDLEGVVEVEVRDVGRMPLATVVEGHSEMPYAFYDLLRAERDWACDLFAVEEGEHFIRVMNNINAEPTDTNAYYRVSGETAARLESMDPSDAYGAMARIVGEVEGCSR